MIIDFHAHVCAAPELYQWKSVLMSARGAHGFKPEDVFGRLGSRSSGHQTQSPNYGFGRHGRPVPFAAAVSADACREAREAGGGLGDRQSRIHRATGGGVSQRVSRECADFRRLSGEPVSFGFPELERCVKKLGFIGTLIDTDPGEGDNSTPTLGGRVLVSAMGKDGGAGYSGADPFDWLQKRPRKL